MTCPICRLKIERSDIKVGCSDCGIFFHGSCVKITAIDLDFIRKSKTGWRCQQCASQRRASFSRQPDTALQSQNKQPLSSSYQTQLPLPPPPPSSSSSSSEPTPLSTSPTFLSTIKQSDGSHNITLEMIYAKVVAIEENQKSQINALLEKNTECVKRISSLEAKVNNLEQQLLANCIEIFNVPAIKPNISYTDAVIKVLREGLNLNVDERDIEQCYMKKITLKKHTSNGNSTNNKNILHVKLTSRFCKEKILKAKRERREQINTNLINAEARKERMFINESLTYETRKLYQAASTIKKSKGYKYVWIRNGAVYMRKEEGDNFIKINSSSDLLKL